jgi:hypothetical protein
VQGWAAGGGLSLALLGDVLILGRSARVRSAYTAIGLTPDGGMSWTLPRAVGVSRARDLILTNHAVSAAEAEAMGLASRVVDDQELRVTVDSLAAELADGATDALGAARDLVHGGLSRGFAEQREEEGRSIAARADSAQGREGVRAFIERRVTKLTSAQHEAIKRWFWLTASGEYFKGWNSRQMADDRDAVRAFAEGAAEIDVSTGLPRDVLWRRSQFRTTNAPSKLLGLLLAGADPVDLRNGQRIDTDRALSWQNDKEFHHFFPKSFLKARGVSSARANVCANLIMLTSVSNIFVSDQPPSMYLKDMCDTDGEDIVRERLARSLVNDAAYAAARRDDYEAFLEIRSRTLHERLMDLIGPTGGTASDYASFSEEAEVSGDDGEPVDRDSAD